MSNFINETEVISDNEYEFVCKPKKKLNQVNRFPNKTLQVMINWQIYRQTMQNR